MMVENNYKLQVDHHSMIGTCLQSSQPYFALNIKDEAHWVNNPFLPETRSVITIPLIVGQIVVGVLTVQSTREATFSEEDIPWLQKVAEPLALAINLRN
jgi:GAF domain-containing protein